MPYIWNGKSHKTNMISFWNTKTKVIGPEQSGIHFGPLENIHDSEIVLVYVSKERAVHLVQEVSRLLITIQNHQQRQNLHYYMTHLKQ